MRPPRLAALLVASALVLGGCGASGPGGANDVDDATIVLDFTPNAVHVGMYTALARNFDGAEGVRMRLRAPSEATDSVRLLSAGRVDMAVLDISDLALARAGGRDIVGVMALVQRPLAAVLAQPGIRRPRDLEGRSAGVSGLPSDVAVLDSVVRGDGGDPSKVRRTTIGFTAVPALVGGRVDAATAFWNAEGVALGREAASGGGSGAFREFRVDDFGAPRYPELVLCVTRELLQDDPRLIRGTINALRRGYDEALLDPPLAVETLTRRVDGLERATVTAELAAVQGAFETGGRFGVLDRERLRAWSRWATEFGIVDERPDVEAAFAFDAGANAG